MRETFRPARSFLFTDVEGSTRLLHELGAEAYAEALAEHRRIIREACAAQGGVEVDTQGDAFSFSFAFPTAPVAFAAAAALTDSLAPGPIHVRVGLHTGAPLVTDEGYVGDDVHRAARIAAVGHGGQVLVAASTAALVGSDGLVDLGEHRFKDLPAPEPSTSAARKQRIGSPKSCFEALNGLPCPLRQSRDHDGDGPFFRPAFANERVSVCCWTPGVLAPRRSRCE